MQRIPQQPNYLPPFCNDGIISTLLVLDKSLDPSQYIADKIKPEDTLDHGKALHCAYCHTIVTYHGSGIEQMGQHVHSFTNPGGYEFTIGCFSKAYCQLEGEPSQEWTWFPAYYWQYALCHQCQEHLGWYYQSGEMGDDFFGLILDRLISETDH